MKQIIPFAILFIGLEVCYRLGRHARSWKVRYFADYGQWCCLGLITGLTIGLFV